MVETLATAMMLLGLVLAVVGAFAGILVAFRESVLWGLAVVFFPIAHLVFLILYWPVAKKWFFWELTGLVLMVIGLIATGHIGHHHVR